MKHHLFEAICDECSSNYAVGLADHKPTLVKATRAQRDVWIMTHRGTTKHAKYTKIETITEHLRAVAPNMDQLQLVDDPLHETMHVGGDDVV